MVEKCVYGKLGSENENGETSAILGIRCGRCTGERNETSGYLCRTRCAYYFDDGSDIQTIRKENPFNFNIQAGIRLTY